VTTGETAVHAFQDQYGATPDLLIRSPGRVNLIGEHTDYNDGFVLPLAIERALWIALRARSDDTVRVWSALGDQSTQFSLSALTSGGGWVAYVQGVANELLDVGHSLSGWEGTITSDIPTGAGLSSSAALELGTAKAFSEVSQFDWDPVEMAVISQRAENDWVGMNCGIMDQLICAAGQPNQALLIDCRSLTWTPAVVPGAAVVVVLDTSTRRKLVGSAYNDRVASCREAASVFEVAALRDLDWGTLVGVRDRLDPVVFRRARHVVSENDRTLQMAEALNAENLIEAGELMQASHTSMRDDFEISSGALDAMVEAAMDFPGCYGARMTGGGFGGSCVALVDADHLDSFESQTLARYQARTGLEGTAIRTRPTAGTSVEEIPTGGLNAPPLP
jgi:galactokinase